MSNQHNLNYENRTAYKAKLGDKLDAIITLLNQLQADYNALVTQFNQLRSDYNTHVHGGVTAGAGSTAAPAATAATAGTPTSAPAVEALN